MQTTVTIGKICNQGEKLFATVQGRFGGGYQGAFAGADAESAGIFATRQMIRYGTCNPDGAVLVAPADVLAVVPERLRKIEPRR
jgi:hypothetical protein